MSSRGSHPLLGMSWGGADTSKSIGQCDPLLRASGLSHGLACPGLASGHFPSFISPFPKTLLPEASAHAHQSALGNRCARPACRLPGAHALRRPARQLVTSRSLAGCLRPARARWGRWPRLAKRHGALSARAPGSWKPCRDSCPYGNAALPNCPKTYAISLDPRLWMAGGSKTL